MRLRRPGVRRGGQRVAEACAFPATQDCHARHARVPRLRWMPGSGSTRIGAGDRDRTDDIQLGKLTFYH